MKKAKKGLLLSLLTLLMAVAVTATSTYAWFVTNRTVSATNMQVTVKSDTTWLVIGTAATRPASVAAIGTGTTVAAGTAANAQVLPVMYDDEEEGTIKWKTADGTAYDNGAAKNATYTAISSDDVSAGKYFVKYTFYVGLTDTTAEDQVNLRVKSMAVTADASGDAATFQPAVSAMVDCNETGGAKIDYPDISGMNADAYAAKSALLATVVKGTVYQIDVYVYINGDNSVVKSENATTAKLGGFKLSIEFMVSAPPAV